MLFFYETETYKVLRGRLLNPLSDTECQYFPDGVLIGQKQNGTCAVLEIIESESAFEKYGWTAEEIPFNSGVILPPFIDLHFHWVQNDVRDDPKVSLLEWLERYTFPEEARFSDPDYAEVKAKEFWNHIYSVGTAGGLCYSSIHNEALDAAMRYAPPHFMIGGVLMTMNCPAFLRQSISEAANAVVYGAETYGSRYCVTPRFAPTTHPEVMKAGAAIANKYKLFQQSHLDETLAEIEWVLGIYEEFEGFEDVSTYTEIYERCNVLGPRTVMGHAIHLTEEELHLLAKTDTAIASCPTSNAPTEDRGLGSGLFNFEQVEAAGIRWALASDIGGGPYLSMLDVIDSFVRQNHEIGRFSATYTKALHRSTLAGAKIMQIDNRKGNFAKGKSFDCIQADCHDTLDTDATAETILPAIIEQAANRSQRDSLIQATVIEGELVFERTDSELAASDRDTAS